MDKMELQKQLGATRDEMVGKRYRHFKGGIYVVLTIAVHSESDEPLVIYQTLDRPDLVRSRRCASNQWSRYYKTYIR